MCTLDSWQNDTTHAARHGCCPLPKAIYTKEASIHWTPLVSEQPVPLSINPHSNPLCSFQTSINVIAYCGHWMKAEIPCVAAKTPFLLWFGQAFFYKLFLLRGSWKVAAPINYSVTARKGTSVTKSSNVNNLVWLLEGGQDFFSSVKFLGQTQVTTTTTQKRKTQTHVSK